MPVEIKEPGVTTHSLQFEDRPSTGMVISAGKDVEEIKEGDVVFFGQYSHVKIVHDDIVYLVMRAEDIYLVANTNDNEN